MNIWLKSQNTRQIKLRESFIPSSGTSLKSPLPIIPQNQKIDDILSNSNISIQINGASSQNQQNHFDQNINNYGFRSIDYFLVQSTKSTTYVNQQKELVQGNKETAINNSLYHHNQISSSTGIDKSIIKPLHSFEPTHTQSNKYKINKSLLDLRNSGNMKENSILIYPSAQMNKKSQLFSNNNPQLKQFQKSSNSNQKRYPTNKQKSSQNIKYQQINNNINDITYNNKNKNISPNYVNKTSKIISNKVINSSDQDNQSEDYQQKHSNQNYSSSSDSNQPLYNNNDINNQKDDVRVYSNQHVNYNHFYQQKMDCYTFNQSFQLPRQQNQYNKRYHSIEQYNINKSQRAKDIQSNNNINSKSTISSKGKVNKFQQTKNMILKQLQSKNAKNNKKFPHTNNNAQIFNQKIQNRKYQNISSNKVNIMDNGKISQIQFKSDKNYSIEDLKDIKPIKYNIFSDSLENKNKNNCTSNSVANENNNSSYKIPNKSSEQISKKSSSNDIPCNKQTLNNKKQVNKIQSNDNNYKTGNIANKKYQDGASDNIHAKSWKTSLNSFNSLHLYNSSKNNDNNQDSSKVNNSLNNYSLSSHQFGKKSSNNANQSHHTHTSNGNRSKKLLTTNRRNDRRQYIIAIIQYCANQVGMACYNMTTGQIKLTQIIQRMTYMKTISTLQRFYPQQIIFSNTLQNTLLINKLMRIFRRTSFRPVKRNLFDQTKGYYIYALRGNKSQHNPDHKYLSYAALNALVLTMENSFEFTLTYSALNIKWHYLQEVLVLDSQTVEDLQIFINKQTKIIKNTFIDNFKCLTDGGMRMLRANILQPLTDIKIINSRFDLVEILLDKNNKGILEMLTKQLIKFKNYQPITAKFIQNPKCDNIRSVKSYLNGILILSRMCFQLQHLKKKIQSIVQQPQTQTNHKQNKQEIDDVKNKQNTKQKKQNQSKHVPHYIDNYVIKNLLSKLRDKRLQDIRKIIQDNFDAQILKNYECDNNNNIMQNPFKNKRYQTKQRSSSQKAKKDNFIFLFKLQKISDEFAQISRLTYSHTIEDILKIFEQIKQKCPSQNNLKLLYNQSRGYFISGKSYQSYPLDLSHLSTLIQDDIIHINTKSNTITFSTSILISLNNRLKQNQHKLIYQSTELLLTIIKQIQKNMEILFQVNYWISMMDMIMAFVFFIQNYQNGYNVKFCRPQFSRQQNTDKIQLKIEKLRTIWTMQKFNKLSNDISLNLISSSLLIIHKQLNCFDQVNILYSIGFLTILSQIGCLVPACQFYTNIYEVMLSKMDVLGNLQNKMSHFQTQLCSLKNILDNIQQRNTKLIRNGKCLILIDEILKGTQPEEQYALSMATIQTFISCNNNNSRKYDGNLIQNIGIILVSDRTLFQIVGKFQEACLCEFCQSGNSNQEGSLTQMENKGIKAKQKQLLETIETYNFHQNFIKIYKNLQMI